MTEPLRNHGEHGGVTAEYAVQAPRLRCDGTSTAEARRNMITVAAVPPRRSAALTVFRGATTINDGTTAVYALEAPHWHRAFGVLIISMGNLMRIRSQFSRNFNFQKKMTFSNCSNSNLITKF